MAKTFSVQVVNKLNDLSLYCRGGSNSDTAHAQCAESLHVYVCTYVRTYLHTPTYTHLPTPTWTSSTARVILVMRMRERSPMPGPPICAARSPSGRALECVSV